MLLDIYTQQQPYRLAMMMAPSWPQKTAIKPEKARARRSEEWSGIYGVQSKKSKHGRLDEMQGFGEGRWREKLATRQRFS